MTVAEAKCTTGSDLRCGKMCGSAKTDLGNSTLLTTIFPLIAMVSSSKEDPKLPPAASDNDAVAIPPLGI